VSSAPDLNRGSEDRLDAFRASIEAVVHGKSDLVLHVLTVLLAEGHVLLEDVPGVGKTTLGQALAHASGCRFARIQFTADLLPSDIVGVSVYDQAGGEFRFHPGPVFAHVLLADEINRTPPRTQSSLLEAMNEGQVTVDGTVHELPRPFCVVATQNPLEHHGTFPLPESQVDRFLMRLTVGYPDLDSERRLLRETTSDRRSAARVLDAEQIVELQRLARSVQLHADLEDYLLAVVRATRESPDIALGASPRAAQALARAARARALLLGRDHVVPEDLQALFEPVLAHRLRPSWADEGGSRRVSQVLQGIVAGVPLPR
jgi:MoxR-like ATPase